MRVAIAFILLISLAMAFTIDKERPEGPPQGDEQDNKVEKPVERILSKIGKRSRKCCSMSWCAPYCLCCE
ncbi:hypothetical protein ACROYT_G016825 [Oculina patagonica]